MPGTVYDTVEITEASAQLKATFERSTRNGVLVLDGFGASLTVNRGALLVQDGIGNHRRTRRFDKATHGLARIVVLAHSGILSLEALRWADNLDIGVFVLAADGTLQLASAPRVGDDSRLRRAQALAPNEAYGIDLACRLLSLKLDGQAKILASRFAAPDKAETVTALREAMSFAESVDDLRQLEATAAALYFGAWAGSPLTAPRFATMDRQRVPSHWRTFETRRSILASASSNRKADRPLNALLNYTFALLEAEAVLACTVVGLDPGLGIVHLDTKGRASMALDLIEPVRPEVEAFVLDLLADRTFRKAEFVESNDGNVRIRPPLTHELAETLPRWRDLIAPVAERTAHLLGTVMDGRYHPATPLTGTRLRAAQAIVRARKVQASERAARRTPRQLPGKATPLPLGCVECGAMLSNPRHVRCDDCIALDPGQTPAIRSRRGEAISSRKRAIAAWDEAHSGQPFDPGRFVTEILPGLAGVKLSEISAASGYSKASASDIRAGKWAPHVSTWPALADLAKSSPNRPPT